MIGKTLAHFKITAKLGEGGMGEVYRAEDSKLGREVAIKVLPPEVANDPERRTRFEREAKAVAALNHPNIVTVFSIEEHEGTHFIAMELVEGKSFSELIPKDGFSTGKLLNYTTAVADAVAAAHRKGITHRDLKPDNLMLDDEGRVKVMDFGLAKLEEGSIATSGATEMPTESVTQEGKVLGTVAYMSPEQAEGKPVDARSDVFSLGVVLYEMATGQRPFQGDTSISTITAILRDNPDSVTNLNPRLPRHLGRVIRRCLTKDPDRRYQSALDLRNELEELNREIKSGELDSDTTAAVADLPPATKSMLVPLLGASVVILILAVGYLGYRQSTGTEPQGGTDSTQPASSEMQIQQLTNTGKSHLAVISPDGKYVMHVVDDSGQQSLWLRQVSTDSNVQVVPPATVTYQRLAFSTDGETLYFSRQEVGSTLSELFRMPILGGNQAKIGENVSHFALSSDGTQVVMHVSDPANPREDQLAVANVDGGNRKILLTKTMPQEVFGPGAAWSPDGGQIVYFSGTFVGGFRPWLESIDVVSGEVSRVGDKDFFMNDLVWLPDSSELLGAGSPTLFADGQLWLISHPDGAAQRMTRDLSDYRTVSVSADGRALVAVVAEAEGSLWQVDLDGDRVGRRLGNPTGTLNGSAGLDSTADGQIVFTAGATSGALHLWKANPDGSGLQQLTQGDTLTFFPEVCGQQVLFTLVTDDQTINLWSIDLDGSGLTKITDGTIDFSVTCTHEDPTILFTTLRAGTPAIWKGSLEGGEAELFAVSEAPMERAPELSPDGKLLSFESFDPQTSEWSHTVTDLGSGEVVLLIERAFNSNTEWKPDGSAITQISSEEGIENIFSYALDGSEPEQLTFFTDEQAILSFAWQPDGKTLILSRGTTSRDVVLITDFR